MALESPPGPGEEVDLLDLAVLAEGSADISPSQLVPSAALECEVNPSSAIPDP